MTLKGLKTIVFTLEGEDVNARLNTRAGRWAAEDPSTLWSLQTMPNRSISFTPFFIVYGACDTPSVTIEATVLEI
jgi:hypothetical protein